MSASLSDAVSVAVRVTHGETLEEVGTATTSEERVSSFLIDRVPDDVPIWDPFDFSSLAQSHLFLSRLNSVNTVFVVEGGYSQLDEASTLSPRPEVQGDDALGWYLFGSVRNAGFVSMMADRSCSSGGTCWFSFLALDAKETVDLVAPFLPSGGGSSSQSRHGVEGASMMITSSKQLDEFLTTKVLTSPSFRKKRKNLSFLLILSNSSNEYCAVLIAAEKHHVMLTDLVFPRPNVLRERQHQEDNSRHPVSVVKTLLGFLATRYDEMQKNVLPRRGKAGSLPAYLLLPLLVTRVPRNRRADPLDVLHLVQRAATQPASAHNLSLSTRQDSAPPTPPPMHEDDGGADMRALSDHLAKVQSLQNEVESYHSNVQDVERDIQEVLKATENIILEYRGTHDQIVLCSEELESSKRATELLLNHNQQMEVELQRLGAQAAALREHAAEQQQRSAQDAVAMQRASDDGSKELRALESEHRAHVEALRVEHCNRVEKLRAQTATQIAEHNRARARDMEDMRRNIQHVDENISLCVTNTRTVETDLSKRQEELRSIKLEIRSIEVRNAQLEEALGTVKSKSVELKGTKDDRREAQRKLELVEDTIKQFETELGEVTISATRLRAQLRDENWQMNEAQSTFHALCERSNAMKRSVLFASEQTGRCVIDAQAAEQWSDVQRQYGAFRKVVQHRTLAQTAEKVTLDIYDSIAEAQRKESQLLSEKSDLEDEIREIDATIDAAIKCHERELVALSDECTSTVGRIDALRKQQHAKFIERERDLKALRTSYGHLFHEFLLQIEQETTIAFSQDSKAARELKDQQRSHGGDSATTSRTPSTAPTTEQRTTLTAKSLHKHLDAQAEDDMSHWDTCVHLYLQWSNETAKRREIDQETTRLNHRVARVEAAALSVAESIAIERQRLADVEAEVEKFSSIGDEANDALREFVRNAGEQRKEMERAIQGILVDEQANFKHLGTQVDETQERIAMLRSSISETDVKTTAIAREIEEFKASGVDQLKQRLIEEVDKTTTLERKLSSLRQHQRTALGLTAGFYSMEEQSLRAMGLMSMRDAERMFEPALHTNATEPSSKPLRPVSSSSHDTPSDVGGRDDPLRSTVPTAGTSAANPRGVRDTEASYRTVSSVAAATVADTVTSRSSTPVSSVFYFGSANSQSAESHGLLHSEN